MLSPNKDEGVYLLSNGKIYVSGGLPDWWVRMNVDPLAVPYRGIPSRDHEVKKSWTSVSDRSPMLIDVKREKGHEDEPNSTKTVRDSDNGDNNRGVTRKIPPVPLLVTDEEAKVLIASRKRDMSMTNLQGEKQSSITSFMTGSVKTKPLLPKRTQRRSPIVKIKTTRGGPIDRFISK